MSDAWEKKVEHLLRQTGTRVHAPNGLPIRSIRWDGLMTEHEHGDHRDYLFPVDVVCSDPPEVIDGHTFPNNERHALIYTDSNIALTMYECCYIMWHLSRDGAWLAGGYLSNSYRLSVESVDKILAYCKDKEITLTHPNAVEDAR